MEFLQTRPAKVIVICLLSLVAALVCFGLLHSAGVVKNGIVELGGAFAGFIVTVVVLNRVWGEENPLESEAAKAGKSFTYEEVVKALNLRQASPTLANQKAALTDYYRVKRLGDRQELTMHYATTASGIEWLGSATHPTSTKWIDAAVVSHTGPNGEVLKHEYKLKLDLGDLAKGETTPVIHNLMYLDAFKGPEGEWLETHMEQPTGRLTMIVLAPDDMQITKATGGRTIARDELEQTPEQPTVMQAGSVVYWSVNNPTIGARYALKWEWTPRVGATSS